MDSWDKFIGGDAPISDGDFIQLSSTETAGGVRSVCLNALAEDVSTGGDTAKGICTPWEYEQVSKMNLEGAGDVRSTTDNLGDDAGDSNTILSGNEASWIPNEFGLSAYMKFWSDIAGGNELTTAALSVGVPFMVLAGLLALVQGRGGMGSHSHGGNPIAGIRGANW